MTTYGFDDSSKRLVDTDPDAPLRLSACIHPSAHHAVSPAASNSDGSPARRNTGVAARLDSCGWVWVSNCQFSRRIQDWATLHSGRVLLYAGARMKELLLTLLHLAVMTAKLCGPGGVRAVMAENLLLKQQLIVLRRARQRAPNLTRSDRLLCGFWSLFLSPGRIRRVAIALRPSTLLAFHQALVRRKYRRLFSSQPCPKKPDRKGRTRPSSGPSSNSSRAILASAVHGSRTSSRRRSGSTSTRTSCTACWRPTIARPRAEADHRGYRSSATPQTASGVWTSFDASPSCFGATGCSWSWTNYASPRRPQRTRRCRHGRGPVPHVQRRDSRARCTATPQYGSRSGVQGAPVDGEPADFGD